MGSSRAPVWRRAASIRSTVAESRRCRRHGVGSPNEGSDTSTQISITNRLRNGTDRGTGVSLGHAIPANQIRGHGKDLERVSQRTGDFPRAENRRRTGCRKAATGKRRSSLGPALGYRDVARARREDLKLAGWHAFPSGMLARRARCERTGRVIRYVTLPCHDAVVSPDASESSGAEIRGATGWVSSVSDDVGSEGGIGRGSVLAWSPVVLRCMVGLLGLGRCCGRAAVCWRLLEVERL